MVTGCFILSFILKKKKNLFQVLGVFLLLFFTNPYLSNRVMIWWEEPATPLAQLNETYEVGIVLCGVTNPLQYPRDRVHFLQGADRITHAVQLYKEGKIKKLLISGGSGFLLHQDISESKDLENFALMCGVKKKDIIIENESRNTYENALFSAKIVEEQHIEGKSLLITSAFHLPRAKACFAKQKVAFDAFSTDLRGMHRIDYTPESLIVPNVNALDNWTTLIKEWLGVIAYKLAGYS
jgi:uncharacterized SAM-binding protein YcdF (DUF218 family)